MKISLNLSEFHTRMIDLKKENLYLKNAKPIQRY